MKKVIVILLTALMLFSFCGCDAFVEGFKKGYNEALLESISDLRDDEAVTAELEEEIKDDLNDLKEDDKAQEEIENVLGGILEDSREETEVSKKKVSRGVIKGNQYTSEYSGLKFNAPSSWRYHTDEELSALINASFDAMSMDKFSETLAKQSSIYDMMAVDQVTRTNISVMYENTALTCPSGITVDEYFVALERGLSSQFNLEMIEESNVVLSGQKYACRKYNVSTQGGKVQQCYYIRIVDSYVIGVITTLVSGYTAADIEAMFS